MPPPIISDWRAVLAGGLAASAVSLLTPVLAPQIVRPDPFTSLDAAELQKTVSREIEYRLTLLRSELALELPPDATRRRIEALEQAMRALDPSYQPPTSRFSR